MSGQSTKRRKTTATASAGVPIIVSLPPELLETTCGFLDVGTLCTARLVCTQFHDAASRCIRSVELSAETLRARPETNLHNFPNLSRVTVFDVKEDDLLMLAQSRVADAVTHLQAARHLRQVPRRGRVAACSPVMPLRNLASLALDLMPPPDTFSVDRAFPYPQTLRELTLNGVVTDPAANLVTRLTGLTSLRIDTRFMRKPFAAVTALTALQRLEICADSPLAPSVAGLTLLTYLNFTESLQPPWPQHSALASLTRLHRLVHLGVAPLAASSEDQLLGSMAAFTSLRSLDLNFCYRPGHPAFRTVSVMPLSRLTALRLAGEGMVASPFLPRFNLEGLQDLVLSSGVELDRDGVAALRRATGLTHLHLRPETVRRCAEPEDLGTALSHMLQMRALSVDTTAAAFTRCSEAIALLGELTKLRWSGEEFDLSAAVDVCRGLRKLRVLRLFSRSSSHLASSNHMTDEAFLALGKLPELRSLEILRPWAPWGWSLKDSAAEVRAKVNGERHDKGWPPLKTLYVS